MRLELTTLLAVQVAFQAGITLAAQASRTGASAAASQKESPQDTERPLMRLSGKGSQIEGNTLEINGQTLRIPKFTTSLDNTDTYGLFYSAKANQLEWKKIPEASLNQNGRHIQDQMQHEKDKYRPERSNAMNDALKKRDDDTKALLGGLDPYTATEADIRQYISQKEQQLSLNRKHAKSAPLFKDIQDRVEQQNKNAIKRVLDEQKRLRDQQTQYDREKGNKPKGKVKPGKFASS